MSWLFENFELVAELTLNHVALSILPIVLGFAIAVPLGWLANRWSAMRSVVVAGGSLLYTIPSLPLFVMLPYLLGTKITDDRNIVVALTIYAVAMMVRTAADALAAVPGAAVEAATAMGYSAWSRFWLVEFPLAGPVLLAGLRVVSASTIALVSVGAIIGSANLGYLFTNGKQRDFLEEILIGIGASLLIALVFDVLLVLLGRLLMPWMRRGGQSTRARLPLRERTV
ncbi:MULTISPECIES: ABC transporter permease [unclassified Salinibacterium]|uniref:ABC transporter permease n=1 Tax=unclassified Salinibacterium TaxID=2632331 RepID=UPI0018CEA2A2|nr:MULTISPECIES: ABC transporter permease subunit [unclassified Salinibacterium]MBH0052575.1 ABC transporter permease subunit [Salinibacterium sp. SWN139]MBH0081839.1 ABC transporter permease subunit [Salinibacterium sp. SWN167]